MEEKSNLERYNSAKKRVEDIKKFYKHLVVYLVINFVFIGRRIYKDIMYGDSIIEAFTDVNNYHFFFWWGVGLIIHGIVVFGTPDLFGKNWEERKVKEYMNEK
ncbi:2TM domain-containing protein [Lutibacter sp. Hel_I_33_5]|uniref:2TM domain-containing protein n=1 Tax=Lutibacter sp. Hel_I_33_5 TaxID=1566289 RepID=UPI0011AA551A|nr:2TM domain-containing protein [Lutibacter sp. Hel_I_33_5]TVZ55153.1 2TM domain-containing protein [Lutibacter sp. Hel_I_33_5]